MTATFADETTTFALHIDAIPQPNDTEQSVRNGKILKEVKNNGNLFDDLCDDIILYNI